MNEPDDRYELLLRLLERERRASEEEAAPPDLSGAEAERQGLGLARMVLDGMEPGLGGTVEVVFRRADGSPLPGGVLSSGCRVCLRLMDPKAAADAEAQEGGRAPSGVVGAVDPDRLVLILDEEPPGWAQEERVVAIRLPDPVTHRAQVQALHRVADARGDRLARLRRIADGREAPETPRGWMELAGAVLECRDLNRSQAEAVAWALEAPEVALIHGPPGTGKTRCLVALALEASARGESLLACAPSNAAVDHLAGQLVAAGLDVVRLGHPARVSPALEPALLSERVRRDPDTRRARKLAGEALAQARRVYGDRRSRLPREEWKEERERLREMRADLRRRERAVVAAAIDGAAVVCSTLTGAAEGVLGGRRYDRVLVDEAAQALEPAVWIAAARGDRLVLAGDHHQLPPTVVDAEAARMGLAETLFARLHRAHGEAVARMLTVQYRMHERIAAFSSERFYEGRLEAHPEVAGHCLADLPGVEALDPWTVEPHLVVDTSGAGWGEEFPGGGTSAANPGEARFAAALARRLLGAGLPPQDLGVVTPYAAQAALLRSLLAANPGVEVAAAVEVDSVDAFQGREKEAVILSLVRSNTEGTIGFVADERRANVAFTRARRLLVVVGDGATLAADPFWAAYWEYAEGAGYLRTVWEFEDGV